MFVFLLQAWEVRLLSRNYRAQLYRQAAEGKNPRNEAAPVLSWEAALLLGGAGSGLCLFALTDHIWDQLVLGNSPGNVFFLRFPLLESSSLSTANTTLCCSSRNSYCVAFYENSILALSVRYRPFVGFYFIWRLMVYTYALMLAHLRTLSWTETSVHVWVP